jgi:2-keto-4-pentenoate hydratase/2-oxohepta-3-ene-1,7-dioic acid hydratase in catechol pathway
MTIRLVNDGGRAAVVLGDGVADLAKASDGRFGPDPMAAIARWDELSEWAAGVDRGRADKALDLAALGPCVPRPAKVFGIALNYRKHVEETGAELPARPSVFTKFPNCLAGPTADIRLPSGAVDWEAELVVVIGRGGAAIAEERAFDHIAGYCVGQDVSERVVQMAGPRPQFSMGKSYDSFGPIGPAIVSLDGVADPNDLAIWCDVNSERVQDSRTSDLIFDVPALVAYLSSICTLEPGDIVFTGTPSGVGVAHRPPRFLQDGDVVVTGIEGLGELTNRAVAR